MRAYATLSPVFWTRGSGKRLRGHKEAQLVALYLMSSPATNMIGIFHLALPTLCHETGLSLEEARKGLLRCLEEGLVFWDEDEELVFVPALAKHQMGENLAPKDHRVKGVLRELAPFKGHRFYAMFIDRYADSYSLNREQQEAPSKPLRRGDDPDPDPDLVPGPVPDSSPEIGSSPQVDLGGAHEPAPEPARDVATIATEALRDPVRTQMRFGPVESWPEVLAVCESFVATWGREDRPRHQGDPRARVILERFAEGYTVDQLVAAVRGSKFADYIRGNKAHQALKTILRDAAQIDKFSVLTELPSATPPRASDRKKQPDGGRWSPQME